MASTSKSSDATIDHISKDNSPVTMRTLYAILDRTMQGLADLFKSNTKRLKDMEDRLARLEETPVQFDGVFDHSKAYRKNHIVVHDGSMWIAKRESYGTKPPSEDWQLCVKRGRNGKDGIDWDER